MCFPLDTSKNYHGISSKESVIHEGSVEGNADKTRTRKQHDSNNLRACETVRRQDLCRQWSKNIFTNTKP